ncbi:MAG: NHL repeat-containing protein [Chitinophagales bacterium]
MNKFILSSIVILSLAGLFFTSCKKSNNSSSSGSGNNSNGTVSTLTGNSTEGFADGTATTAEFSSPYSVAVDNSGNVYVADYGNNRIRKITPDGTTSTFAGSGTAGTADGAGAAAQFTQPRSVAVDAAGNVFVCDYNNEDIRKITPAGVVSTVAGNGYAGYADGQGTSAQFASPTSIAVDASDNLYVADLANERIRKITAGGMVTTLAGSDGYGLTDGKGSAAQFHFPNGIAVDAAGNLYVSDSQNNAIRKITPDGTVSTLAGNGQQGYVDGPGSSAEFDNPGAVTVDASGNVYVAGPDDDHIRKITPAGVVSTTTGNGGSGLVNGSLSDARFNSPTGLAVDAAGKNIYVAEYGNNDIRKISFK